MKGTVKLFKFIIDFMDELSDDEIQAILDNRASLKLQYTKAQKRRDNTGVKKIKKNVDIGEVRNKLEVMNSREEAEKYLVDLKLNKESLKQIAKFYNIAITTKDTNNRLVYKIVEGVVGAKLKFDVLLNTNLK